MNNRFISVTPDNAVSGGIYKLTESWGSVEPILDSGLSESSNGIIQFPSDANTIYKPGEKYITGVFMQADIVNGNKRVYPRAVLDRAINEYMESRVRKGRALGEWNHPEGRVEVDHTEAVLLIEDLWWEGSNVMGRAIISTGDYAEGDKIASLLRIGWRPAVSSRGIGRLVGDMKRDGYMTVDAYKIAVGIDIVYNPSAPDAHVDVVGFNESATKIDEKLTINTSVEENNKVIEIDKFVESLRNFGSSHMN